MTYRVGIYDVDRAYGGPEEGGWWYDTGTLERDLKVSFTNSALAHVYRRRVQKKLNRTKYNNRGPYSDLGSVLGDGRYQALVFEQELPKVFPIETPYYC